MSYSVHFSLFRFFSDFIIFQVVKWMFRIYHDFQFSCNISCPTVDISKFSKFFSVPCHISRPRVSISHFPRFSVFFHIPGPTVCISHFSRFSVVSSFFQVIKRMFLIFHDFQCSCHIPYPTVDISKFFTFFSFPRHISRPKVCISHFP